MYFDCYKLQKSLISKKLTKSILDRFNTIYKEKIYKSNRPNVYELKKNLIAKEPLFERVLEIIFKKFKLLINKQDLKLNKLWLVYSGPSSTKQTIVPYVPHIDKQRYLKAMLYLHDVSLNHGPIHLGKVNNEIDIELKRRRLPKDYKEKKLNIIKDNYLEKPLSPMIGGPGDVIFFDTNTPHKAGKVNEGYFRKVLRFDFERPSFKPKFIMIDNYIKSFLKN